MNKDSLVGSFAFSKAGHDKSQLYVIVAEEGDYVWLCDGRLKNLSKPKKKRKKHVQPVRRAVNSALSERLCNKEKVLDEEIKYEIKHYSKEDKI